MEQAIATEGIHWLRELGPYGPVMIVAVLYFADKWGFIKSKNEEGSGNKQRLINIEEKIHEVKDMVKDYHPDEGLKKLPECIDKNTDVLKELVLEIKYLNRDLQSVKEKVSA